MPYARTHTHAHSHTHTHTHSLTHTTHICLQIHRQAETMVFNELLFQYRGSISGWKLSPIRDFHRKKLQPLQSRPSSTLPWMENNSQGSSTQITNFEPARSKSTEPMASIPLRPVIECIQGSNVLEIPARQQFFVIQSLQDKYAEKRSSQQQPTYVKEGSLPGPQNVEASMEEQSMPSSTEPKTFSRSSSKQSLSKGSTNFSQVRHENSGNNGTGGWSGDWFEPAERGSAVGSAEPYLSFLKAKMTNTLLSRRISLSLTQ
jgi:hypothetical protein